MHAGPRPDDAQQRIAELERQLAAARAALAAFAASKGDGGDIPPPFALAMASPQNGRHQAVLLGGGAAVVLGRDRPEDPARAWRMTAAVLDGLTPRSPRQMPRRTDQLPPGVEAVAKRREGKLAVCVSTLPGVAGAGAVRCAQRALGARRPASAVLPVLAGVGGAVAGLRAHALATSAGATALAAGTAAVVAFAPPGVPTHATTPPPAAAGTPASALPLPSSARGGSGSPGHAPAGMNASARVQRTVHAPGAAGSTDPAPAPAASPGPTVPVPSPVPSSPPLPLPSVSVTVSVPPLPGSPHPVVSRVLHVVKPATRLVCHLDLLGIRVCVRV
jgi:hypothetical protein